VRQPGPTFLNVATPERMQAIGAALGHAIDETIVATDAPFVIALEGELGAGKTTLVSGILRAYGITGPVRSPTYTLIEPYEAVGKQLYHLDLYRLVDPQEVEPLGIRELLDARSVLLIEWPSKAVGALPAFELAIEIDYPPSGQSGRTLTLRAISSSGHNVMQRIVAAIPELQRLSSSFN
jgi:tRNA threonylcarbamoyladenosine biosynthesis protein TsaE